MLYRRCRITVDDTRLLIALDRVLTVLILDQVGIGLTLLVCILKGILPGSHCSLSRLLERRCQHDTAGYRIHAHIRYISIIRTVCRMNHGSASLVFNRVVHAVRLDVLIAVCNRSQHLAVKIIRKCCAFIKSCHRLPAGNTKLCRRVQCLFHTGCIKHILHAVVSKLVLSGSLRSVVLLRL